MVGVSTNKVLLVCLCLICISSFQLQKQAEIKTRARLVSGSHHSYHGFYNRTGTNTTLAQVNSFINFINSASSYFRDDTKARLDYISDQMNKTYGIPDYGFSVIQQGDEDNTGWAIYSYQQVFAGVAAGVDKIFPTKSYMFLLEPNNSGRVYVWNQGQKGSGINSTLEAYITKVILSLEPSSSCFCSGITREISDRLNSFDIDAWSVFCAQSQQSFDLNVYPRNNKYIYTRPRHCYYGIYQI